MWTFFSYLHFFGLWHLQFFCSLGKVQKLTSLKTFLASFIRALVQEWGFRIPGLKPALAINVMFEIDLVGMEYDFN